jgi:hypothetical protein
MTTTGPQRKRYLTDICVGEAPVFIRGHLREWCAGDKATEDQLERLDDYVRAGMQDEAEANEVRYKWFRKGAFDEPGSWKEWTDMMEKQMSRKWRAYLRKKKSFRVSVIKGTQTHV